MDLWLSVKTEYAEYMLFSENVGAEWIFIWFNEQNPEIFNKLKYSAEIKIEHDIVDKFFHKCLDIIIDTELFINNNPSLFPHLQTKYTSYDINIVRQMAKRIINEICIKCNDNFGNGSYYFGFEE